MGADLNIEECIGESGINLFFKNKNECIEELGKLYFKFNNYKDAIKYLELSININNDIESLMYLTEIYKKQEKYDLMIKYYKIGSELTNDKCLDNEELNNHYIYYNDKCLFELAIYYYVIEEDNMSSNKYLKLINKPTDESNKLLKKIFFDNLIFLLNKNKSIEL